MKQKILDAIRILFPVNGKKRCAVIEEGLGGFTVTFARFNEAERKFTDIKCSSLPRLEGYAAPFGMKMDHMVVALNKSSATTVQKRIYIQRDEPKTPMRGEELEELVFKAFWEFLNTYRARASKKMGTAETDLVLAYFEVVSAGVGKYAIINPASLTGSDFFMELRGTFIPRTLLPMIEHLRKCARKFYIVERNAALSTLIAEERAIVIYCDDATTEAFAASPEECAFMKTIDWRFTDALRAIATALGTDSEIARNIFFRYTEGEMSERLSTFIKRELECAFTRLFAAIETLQKRKGRRVPVHMACRFPLPRGEDLFGAGKHISFHAFDAVKERLEIAVVEPGAPVDTITTLLLFYPFSYPTNASLIGMLTRRVKWLIAYTNP